VHDLRFGDEGIGEERGGTGILDCGSLSLAGASVAGYLGGVHAGGADPRGGPAPVVLPADREREERGV
jgi:hypothetical protein